MTNLAHGDTNALFEVVRDLVGASTPPAEVSVHPRDSRTTVFFGSEIAVHVAHTPEEERALIAERRCFEKLGSRVSFRVPRSLGTRAMNGCMVEVRTRIVGAARGSVNTPARSQAFGMWVGRALAEMHDAFTSVDLRDLAFSETREETGSVEAMRDAVEQRLTGAARDRALRFVEHWSARERGGECFSHGAFDEFSFAFESGSGVPRGVNDLRNAGLRRPAFDLAYLCDYGEHVLRAAEEGYALRAGSRVRIAHGEVRATHAAMALSRLARLEEAAALERAVLHASRAVAESNIA